VFHVALHGRLIKLTSNESLGIKDGVGWVDCDLVLGWVTDQPLGVGECHVRWSSAVTLIIGNDFDLK